MSRPTECAASVEDVRVLAPDVMKADLRIQGPAEFHFDAGQWVTVPFGPKAVRAYSIASTPRSRRLITLCADVSPGGIGSEWFRGLWRGQSVRFKGPTGGFVFHRADPRRALFVAEEIGIVYDAEFRSLARRYPAFTYFSVAREAPAGWRADRGEAAEAVDRLVHNVNGLVAYVSGGGNVINAVRAVLMARGLDRKSVRWERFW